MLLQLNVLLYYLSILKEETISMYKSFQLGVNTQWSFIVKKHRHGTTDRVSRLGSLHKRLSPFPGPLLAIPVRGVSRSPRTAHLHRFTATMLRPSSKGHGMLHLAPSVSNHFLGEKIEKNE